MSSGSFKDVIYKMCLEIIYYYIMYKKDLALNNLQWLICHKTKQNQTLTPRSTLTQCGKLPSTGQIDIFKD